jgi:hypothetical protein
VNRHGHRYNHRAYVNGEWLIQFSKEPIQPLRFSIQDKPAFIEVGHIPPDKDQCGGMCQLGVRCVSSGKGNDVFYRFPKIGQSRFSSELAHSTMITTMPTDGTHLALVEPPKESALGKTANLVLLKLAVVYRAQLMRSLRRWSQSEPNSSDRWTPRQSRSDRQLR